MYQKTSLSVVIYRFFPLIATAGMAGFHHLTFDLLLMTWPEKISELKYSRERSGQVTQASVGKKLSLCLFDFCRCFVAFENSVWQIRFLEKKNIFEKKNSEKKNFKNKFFSKFFWNFLDFFFFRQNFFFQNFFFQKIFLNLQLMFQVSNLVSILNVISIVSFISQCTYNFTRLWFNISFHFEFQVSCLNTANQSWWLCQNSFSQKFCGIFYIE